MPCHAMCHCMPCCALPLHATCHTTRCAMRRAMACDMPPHITTPCDTMPCSFGVQRTVTGVLELLQLPLNSVAGADGTDAVAAPAGFQEALLRENAMALLVPALDALQVGKLEVWAKGGNENYNGAAGTGA
eukprot:226898-Chlamydomonas_euryale.AAC.4